MLHGLFKSYTQSLGKLAQAGPPKEDVVGAEEAWLQQNQGQPALVGSLFTPFACEAAGPSEAGRARPSSPRASVSRASRRPRP